MLNVYPMPFYNGEKTRRDSRAVLWLVFGIQADEGGVAVRWLREPGASGREGRRGGSCVEDDVMAGPADSRVCRIVIGEQTVILASDQ